jgi:hypothetical protein
MSGSPIREMEYTRRSVRGADFIPEEAAGQLSELCSSSSPRSRSTLEIAHRQVLKLTVEMRLRLLDQEHMQVCLGFFREAGRTRRVLVRAEGELLITNLYAVRAMEGQRLRTERVLDPRAP